MLGWGPDGLEIQGAPVIWPVTGTAGWNEYLVALAGTGGLLLYKQQTPSVSSCKFVIQVKSISEDTTSSGAHRSRDVIRISKRLGPRDNLGNLQDPTLTSGFSAAVGVDR